MVLDGVDGRVTFDGVSFGYDPTLPVLHDVSFDVAAGQTIALVGRTGAGKTTIANLVPRFYDVSRGTVRVDGHDVRSVTRTSLRGQMAMVLQEPFLFGGTVARLRSRVASTKTLIARNLVVSRERRRST